MPSVESILLRCNDPQSQRQFYCDILGMDLYDDSSVGYGDEQASIYFLKAEGRYELQANDAYWKIALSVPNIELAYQQLTTRDIQVSVPGQFQDVGFLAKFSDPEGFAIELIDHWFQGNRPDEQINQSRLGGGAHFNLITLRTAEIDKVCEYCASCGMKILSIQPVEKYGFTLYFFAFTADVPPSTDPYSVENREWLYQRQYTVLEVQYVYAASKMVLPVSGQVGYAGTVFANLSGEFLNSDLSIGSAGVLQRDLL